MGENYGSLKNVDIPIYPNLSLKGGPANAAVACMREEKILPAEPTLKGSPSAKVDLNKDGIVTIEEYGTNAEGTQATETSRLVPGLEEPKSAVAVTPEVVVEGLVADDMRKRAQACAFKSVPFKP